MKDLPHGATLLDVVKAIRGGQLLNVYIRPCKKLAHVSFLDASAAAAFLNYSKRAAVLVLGKQVELVSDDRQYRLSVSVGNKISSNGATRNLVIRRPKADTTSQSIRNDLEHIHNLEVVDISIINGEAWISLNSVKSALTARACMQSRSQYIHCVIEHYPDECKQPLSDVPKKAISKPKPPKATARNVASNRFQILAREDSDDVDDEEEEEEEAPKDQTRQPRSLKQGFSALGVADWRRRG